MARRKYFSKKQVRVLNDLFKGELDEQGVLDKHKVWRAVYDRWLGDERFLREFERRMRSAHRHSEIIIARYVGLAAAKLVELTESESQETARKACLDVIGFRRDLDKQGDKAGEEGWRPSEIPPEVASRLLAALAEAPKAKEKT